MRRWSILLALAFALVGVMFVTAPTGTAEASTIPPGIGNPLNILPSTVIEGTTAASAPEALALWSKTPQFWTAVQEVSAAAANGATASAASTAAVAAEASTFAIPAIAPALLTKAGAVGAVLGAGDLGISIGHHVSQSLGFQDATTCAVQGAVLAPVARFFTGVNCTQYDNALSTAERNVDQTPNATGSMVCEPSAPTKCVQLMGSYPYNGGTKYIEYCLQSFGGEQNYAYQSGGVWVGASGAPSRGGFPSCAMIPSPGVWWNPSPAVSAPMTAYCAGGSSGCPGGVATVGASYANPPRKFTCTITNTDGTTSSADSASFFETDATLASPLCPPASPGKVPDHLTIKEVTSGSPDQTVLDQPTTDAFKSASNLYPECATGSCMLDLQKGSVSCFTSATLCTDWFSDPSKTDDYVCLYGGHTVALTECNAYAPTFDPQKVAQGDQYADPATGDDADSQTGPKSSVDAFGTPAADASQSRDCFPSGWAAFNPVEWVMMPVQCALEWAFVPRASVVQADMDGLTTALDNKMPGQLISTVKAWNLQPPEDGCDGITVSVPFLGPPFQIMAACDGDLLHDMAGRSRIFGDFVAAIAAAIAVTRHIARVVGFDGLGSNGGGD